MAKLIRYRELQPLPCESRWFVPYRILPGVTAIFEPCHFQEVASFLIEGSRCALLFDSGMGLGNIKAVVDALTNKPVTLVNSHSHFDHVGGNWQFGETHLLNVPEAVRKLENGFSLPEDDENRSPEALHLSCRPWFDLARFCVRPCRVVPIQEGDRFDLGGRTLRVLATPGHSRDGIMLADDANRIRRRCTRFWKARSRSPYTLQRFPNWRKTMLPISCAARTTTRCGTVRHSARSRKPSAPFSPGRLSGSRTEAIPAILSAILPSSFEACIGSCFALYVVLHILSSFFA